MASVFWKWTHRSYVDQTPEAGDRGIVSFIRSMTSCTFSCRMASVIHVVGSPVEASGKSMPMLRPRERPAIHPEGSQRPLSRRRESACDPSSCHSTARSTRARPPTGRAGRCRKLKTAGRRRPRSSDFRQAPAATGGRARRLDQSWGHHGGEVTVGTWIAPPPADREVDTIAAWSSDKIESAFRKRFRGFSSANH